MVRFSVALQSSCDVAGKNIGALSPLSGGNALAIRRRQAKVEIGSAVPPGGRGCIGRIRRSECAVEDNGSQRSTVAGVERVDAIPPELKAKVQHMAVVSHDHRIRSLNHRILESLLDSAAADVGENSGARPAGISAVETQVEQPWPACIGVCDSELRAQMPTLVSNSVPLCSLTWLTPKRTSFSRFELKVWLQSTT